MKKFITLFITLCIVFSILGTFTVFAEYETGQVVTISDLAELEKFRDEVNSGNTYEGIYFYLSDDIDMSEKYGEGKETWTPIGTEEHPFNGTFNGCGHTINLSVYMDYDTEAERGGLFGYTGSKSKITRLTVSGNVLVLGWLMMKPTSGDGTNIGAVAGYNKGIIENCANTANVEYTGNVGHTAGIAGKTEGTIINCYNIGTVKISGNQGNYIAYAEDNTLIQNCYYLSETESTYGKTAEQFACGEVTYLLNGGKTDRYVLWRQDIGDDALPTLNYYRSIVHFNDYDYKYYNPNITSDNKIKTYTACATGGKDTYKKIFSYDELLNNAPLPIDGEDIEEKYNEEFFKNKFLIIKYFACDSSSRDYEITSVKENANGISVDIMDEYYVLSSDDITYWMLFAEVDRSLSDKELNINYIPYNINYYEGRPASQKDFLPEDNLKLDYDIITTQDELTEKCADMPSLVSAYSSIISDKYTPHPLLIISWQEGQNARGHKISSVKYSKDKGYDITLLPCTIENGGTCDVITDYCAVIIIPKSTADANVRIRTEEEKTYPYTITALRIRDEGGNEIISPVQGKSFIVETDIVKTKERNEKDFLFVAVYDKDGALMSLDYVKAKFALDSEYSFGFNIPAQEKIVGSVKAFVWNTFNSTEPLAQAQALTPVVLNKK